MAGFTIHDKKATSYREPFNSVNRATAMREISMGLREETPMRTYASDFSLYQTSVFDVFSGITTPCLPPEFVCEILELLEIEPMTPVRVADSVEDSHAVVPARLIPGE